MNSASYFVDWGNTNKYKYKADLLFADFCDCITKGKEYTS